MATSWVFDPKKRQYVEVDTSTMDPNRPFSDQLYPAEPTKAGTTGISQEVLDRISAIESELGNRKSSKALTSQATDAEGTDLGEIAPIAAFTKAYGLPALGMTPVQSWLSNQATPTYASFLANSFFPGTNTWSQYLSNQGWRGARKGAADLFRQALSAPEDLGGQGGFVEYIGDYLNDFMKNVLGNFYASPMASWLSSKVGALQNQYTAETGGTGNSFLDYLKQKFNLNF